MRKSPLGRMVARGVIAIGIILSVMLASGAPSDGSIGLKHTTPTTQQ